MKHVISLKISVWVLASSLSACSLEKNIEDTSNGTVPIVNFSNIERVYAKAFLADADATSSVQNTANGVRAMLPDGASAVDAQSVSAVLAIERVATQFAESAIGAEINGGTKSFLEGIPLDKGPNVSIDAFIDRLAQRLWKRESANAEEKAVLTELYNGVVADRKANGLNAAAQLRAGLIYVAAAAALAPRAVSY